MTLAPTTLPLVRTRFIPILVELKMSPLVEMRSSTILVVSGTPPSVGRLSSPIPAVTTTPQADTRPSTLTPLASITPPSARMRSMSTAPAHTMLPSVGTRSGRTLVPVTILPLAIKHSTLVGALTMLRWATPLVMALQSTRTKERFTWAINPVTAQPPAPTTIRLSAISLATVSLRVPTTFGSALPPRQPQSRTSRRAVRTFLSVTTFHSPARRLQDN